MRARHRIPSVFNLSMVDVLCCALGCVILLWLVNLREAKQKAAQAGKSDELVIALRRDLTAAQNRLDDFTGQFAALREQFNESQNNLGAVRSELADAEAKMRDTAKLLTKTRGERDTASARIGQLEKDLNAVRAESAADEADLNKRIAALKAEKSSTEDMLARRNKDINALEKRSLADRDRIAGLEADLKSRTADAASKLKDVEARVKEYRDKFAAEEALAKGLEKEIAKRIRSQEDSDKNTEGLRAAKDSLARDLDRYKKDLESARRNISSLEDDKKGLIATAERERVAADNRFAGIQLTGRRVVFLVDMSGSMEYIDDKTPAPEKWSGVRETLVKIMRSLPSLEKYQVITFSDKVSFLFGGEDGWLDYDSKSAGRVLDALSKTKPKGGTNMYSAFEATFRFRSSGLDTVYFLSDGLPNMGEGLTDEQAKGLKETEQGEILGKYIRNKLKTDWNREIRGQGRVKINAVGFFYESPDVGAFLWALTRENDGGFVGMSKP